MLCWLFGINIPAGVADQSVNTNATLPISFTRTYTPVGVMGHTAGGNWARVQTRIINRNLSTIAISSHCHSFSYGAFTYNVICIGY